MLSLITAAKLNLNLPVSLSLLQIKHENIGSKVQVKSMLTNKFNPFNAVVTCRKKKDLAAKKSATLNKVTEALTPYLIFMRESTEYQDALVGLLSGLHKKDDYFVTFTGDILRNVISFHLDATVTHITSSTLEAILSKGYQIIESR